MNQTTKFERRISNMDKGLGVPEELVDAAVYVNDTLELAQFSADHVFGKRATPEIALAIFDRMNTERLRRVADAEARRRAEEK